MLVTSRGHVAEAGRRRLEHVRRTSDPAPCGRRVMAAALYQRQSVFQPSPLDEEDALILSNDDKRSSYATIEVPSTVKSIYSSFVTALVRIVALMFAVRPFMLCLFAFPLVMVQPVLQVLQSLHYYNSYAPMVGPSASSMSNQ
ncbi:hypothetical protein DYB32_004136 [Aphanomyces invadans]|uniref:Uncharacterized protein n=1 Tax=Aphanomyces invadans TaxID=157072 RepID=A0A418B1B8_9STRA|nr:hypothetical protein DYB32_004136 [Aphanomyces invadans]